jgi:plastocyanin
VSRLVTLGFELRWGESSPASGQGSWVGGLRDASTIPADPVDTKVWIEGPDAKPASVRLLLTGDGDVADLAGVGDALHLPATALEASIARILEDGASESAGCTFEVWPLPQGRMVLWRDGAGGSVMFDVAIEPMSGASVHDAADAVPTSVDAVPTSVDEACLPQGPAVTVEAHDLWFAPAEVSVPASGGLIRLENVGRTVHNLTVDELDLQVAAARGLSAEATLDGATPGVYEFYCSISGHRAAGMVGTLVIQ